MEIWGLIVIILSLAFLIYLALKGFSIIIIAPLASLIVIFCTNMPVLETIQENYMTGFINFAKNNYLIFLFAAIFGKFMEDSGAAKSIAKGIMRVTGTTKKYNVLLAVVLISAVLTYGGVSLFVVIFAVLPIAKPLFRDLQIPWHLFLAAFGFGACTFTMTMLPGTPAIQNVIPTTYFGTDVAAAPLVGFVAAIVVIAINLWYLKWALAKTEKEGQTYDSEVNLDKTQAKDSDNQGADEIRGEKLPPFLLSILPPVLLLILLNAFKMQVVLSLMIAVAACLIIFWKYIEKKITTLNQGALNTVVPIINTCADVGYGSVIAASVGFVLVTELMANIPGSPLISLFVATTALAGITGSASGGLGIAMEVLSEGYMKLGIDPEVLHRIASIASGGFDALPHNGAVITMLAVAGLMHKHAYKHIFITCVIAPVLAAIPALIIAITMY